MYPTGYEVLCISRLGAWPLQEASAHAFNFSQDGKSYEEGASVASAKLGLDAKATVPLTLVGIMKTQPEPRPHMERLEQVEQVTDLRRLWFEANRRRLKAQGLDIRFWVNLVKSHITMYIV